MEVTPQEAKYRYLQEEYATLATQYGERISQMRTQHLIEMQELQGELQRLRTRVQELEQLEQFRQVVDTEPNLLSNIESGKEV